MKLQGVGGGSAQRAQSGAAAWCCDLDQQPYDRRRMQSHPSKKAARGSTETCHSNQRISPITRQAFNHGQGASQPNPLQTKALESKG